MGKYIRSQRVDRNGIPRDQLSQAEPQNFTGEANVQNLIDTARRDYVVQHLQRLECKWKI